MRYYIDVCRYPAAEALYSPARRIFVFQDSVYKFSEAERITVHAEKMPAFFVSGFFRLDHKSFAFQITGKPLVGNRQRDNCFYISFMKSQSQWLRWLKAVFLQITQVEAVSKERDSAEIQRERQLIVHFIFADFRVFLSGPFAEKRKTGGRELPFLWKRARK